jgi:glycosyltransferase involved in cell wall biosynthesis
MDARKGLHVAIGALARVPHRFELTVAAISDDAAYERRVRALANRLGVGDRISWEGEVPRAEIPRLLREHDILVYPSTDVEAYSLGLLEALASEALVITSAVGGPLEYLRDGENALVFEPGDVDALAEALDRLARDGELRRNLREGAGETAKSLSLDAVVNDFESLLEEAAA